MSVVNISAIMPTILFTNGGSLLMSVVEKINTLKKDKNAVILAHYYVPDGVQAVADYIGDSLLS